MYGVGPRACAAKIGLHFLKTYHSRRRLSRPAPCYRAVTATGSRAMGHNSWIARAERIESIQRAETSRGLIADAVALVDKWNADIERRKDSQYGYADRASVRGTREFQRNRPCGRRVIPARAGNAVRSS